MRVGELILSLPGCHTWESWLYASPRQGSRVDPDVMEAGELALKAGEQED